MNSFFHSGLKMRQHWSLQSVTRSKTNNKNKFCFSVYMNFNIKSVIIYYNKLRVRVPKQDQIMSMNMFL